MGAELSLVQPARHRRLENPATKPTPARNNKDAALAAGTSRTNEAEKHAVRVVLRHSVQVEPRLDPMLSTLQPRRIGAIDTAEAIECDRMRRRGRGYWWNGARDGRPLL